MLTSPAAPRRSIAVCLVMALALSTAAGPATQPAGKTIVIPGTLEVCPAYLRVHVQLTRDGKPLMGEASGLEGLGNVKDLNDLNKVLDGQKVEAIKVDSFMAYLDTGASASLISRATADGFKLLTVRDAVYHEFGLHGETPMDVSQPYALSLSSSTGKAQDAPGKWSPMQRDAVFEVNTAAAANPLIEMAMGPTDVIGMPAIRNLVVEIDPAPLLGTGDLLGKAKIDDINDLTKGDLLDKLGEMGVGPAVLLHPGDFAPKNFDLEIPLHYADFSRHENPADKGPRPTLAKNPTIKGIETVEGTRSFTGDWLLDTGAPATLISTNQAIALGLLDDQGSPVKKPDFELPLGGVGGQVKPAAGFHLQRLRVTAADGRVIEYRHVAVLVNDVTAKLDNGQVVTLDGVFGLNLLLPTVAGLGEGLPTDFAAGPFQRIWIDGPRGRLLLQMNRPAPATAPAKTPADLTPATVPR